MNATAAEIAASSETSIAGVFGHLVRHPLEAVIYRWNWKAAVLSAMLRAPIFFWAYLFQKHGVADAVGAMLAQAAFRILFGGVNGAIIQAFRRVQPAWHAVLTIPLVLAAFSHVVEFVVSSIYDSLTGTRGKGKAILVSVAISIISAVFNLFAMRRGVLLVKDETKQSLWRDLKRMPWIALEFISFPLVWTVREKRRRAERSGRVDAGDEDDEF
ncbi:MAG: hypothetical protein ACK4S4_08540 [Pyrinomonadaceae bacterium]